MQPGNIPWNFYGTDTWFNTLFMLKSFNHINELFNIELHKCKTLIIN